MRTGTVNPVEGWGKGGGMGIRMEITYNNNCLCIGNIRKEFAYEIKKVQIFDNKILVLLSIPQEDTETIDNIYAVSDKGNIIWRSESLKQLYPDQINLPYEYITVNGSEIEATDFYGRRYFINIKDGRIIKRDVVK